MLFMTICFYVCLKNNKKISLWKQSRFFFYSKPTAQRDEPCPNEGSSSIRTLTWCILPRILSSVIPNGISKDKDVVRKWLKDACATSPRNDSWCGKFRMLDMSTWVFSDSQAKHASLYLIAWVGFSFHVFTKSLSEHVWTSGIHSVLCGEEFRLLSCHMKSHLFLFWNSSHQFYLVP